ncbi:MAG: hypothetical protein E7620_01520 [Ruminococcaceae bacterium]|nr:hypothetical protein [Oscillospiraceae bacterium]
MKKITVWLLLLAILAGTVSCGGNGENASTTETTPSETEAPPVYVELISEGKALYQIVRPEDTTDAVKQAAIAFRNEIEAYTGVKLTITSDLYAKHTPNYETKCEILFGMTSYPETEQVLSKCGYGDYAIEVIGNKLVIAAYEDENLARACNAFSSVLFTKERGNSLKFTKEELTLSRSVNKIISGLPVFAGKGETSVIDCADQNYMLLVEKTDQASFEAYCGELAQKGYSLYTTHQAAENRFSTYVNEEYTVNVQYFSTRKQIRAIVEPKGALPPIVADAFTATVEPSVTMLGLEYDGNQIGLGMIFRLSDGSFLILDGGNNKAAFMSRFYNKLRELAPDPNNIRVRAWFFSHAHTDHVGTFLQFTNTYCGKITVDRFVFNFATNGVYDSITSGANRGLSAETRKAVKRWTNSEVIKAHTGQVFRFADATVEILYTGEDAYPVAWRDGNTESLVFRVTLGGQTILCLGDEYIDSSDILCGVYGNYLRSSILQASHHGRNGATSALVSMISAETVLWPGGYGDFATGDKLCLRDYNVRMLALCKDLYIAGSQGVTLKLPYTAQNNKDAVMGK